MQLKINTSYVIRVILELARGNRMNCKELAERLNVEESCVSEILRKLNKADILTSIHGRNGGYVLKSDLNTLTLLDVISITENTVKINRCLEEDRFCSKQAVTTCSIRKRYEEIQRMIEDELSMLTFKELLEYGKG